ncbi:MAG: PA0069 family radical SAM protein [Flavobacteriales bacterium]
MIDERPVKGRGTGLQVQNRFLAQERGVFEEEGLDEVEHEATPTRYIETHPRSIVNAVNSPDLPFTWSLNPYQGCEHGCSYCYARPTHEYWGYSAGLDFERVVLVKRNAPELLEARLRARNWDAAPIVISGATDPYQPVERKEGLTRRLLEVMNAYGQAVSIITKNALVLRDLDLLATLAQRNLASVAISFTTQDEALRRVLEPRTSSAVLRLRAIERLSAAGVPVHAMIAPIIPALNEPEVPALLKAAADAGARSAGYTILRTNGAVAPIFSQWLRIHFPDRAEKVLSATRDLHGGELHDHRTGRRMKGEGVRAQAIGRMFQVMKRRYFADRSMPALDRGHFRPPPQDQLDLFQ